MVDQQLHNLRTLRKTYKWYRKLAVRLISQSLLNAHKVYQAHTGDTAPFLDFLHDSIALLVTQALSDPVWQFQDDTHIRLTGRHFIAIRKAEPGAKDQRPTKECRVCIAAGKRTNNGGVIKTVYICPDCPSQSGLHPGDCFKAYHTKLDFSKESLVLFYY